MIERIVERLDVFPGWKSYALAGAAALVFWGEMVGLIPAELAADIMPWILGAMGPTVALKLARR